MDGKIIFVNSYKGGAGKTTLSMMHCIDDLFHDKKYNNVVYMDLDILGTGTRYLFDETKLSEDKCFDISEDVVPITLKKGTDTELLHLAYLSPSFKGHFSLGGIHFINHQEIASESLKEKVLRFMTKTLTKQPNTLFVLDCAPGFSKLEQQILKTCYTDFNKKADILEEYVTTLDSSHIKKCIECLKDTRIAFEVHKRNIRLTLNDIQDFDDYIRSISVPAQASAAADKTWQDITSDIKKQLGSFKAELYGWKYSREIAVRTTYLYEQKLENNVDHYIFTSDNYKKY